MSQRVVALAVDSSDHSEFAFDWYVKYLHRPENYVMLIHVPEGFDVDKAAKQMAKEGEIDESLDERFWDIEKNEAKFRNLLATNNVQGRIVSIPNKTPGPTIVEAAKAQHAFTIVMGTRGLSKLKKVVYGSVSDYVMQNAEIPVIVIKNRHTDE